jgi:two-component system alkaline phosphatase synthesis response regulator PhoP
MIEVTTAEEIGARHGVLELGNLKIDLDTYRVRLDGSHVSLGQQEFDLLAVLAQHPDHVVDANALTSILWSGSGHLYLRRLSVLVFRLRAKVAAARPYSVETVRGRGYGLLSWE